MNPTIDSVDPKLFWFIMKWTPACYYFPSRFRKLFEFRFTIKILIRLDTSNRLRISIHSDLIPVFSLPHEFRFINHNVASVLRSSEKSIHALKWKDHNCLTLHLKLLFMFFIHHLERFSVAMIDKGYNRSVGEFNIFFYDERDGTRIPTRSRRFDLRNFWIHSGILDFLSRVAIL